MNINSILHSIRLVTLNFMREQYKEGKMDLCRFDSRRLWYEQLFTAEEIFLSEPGTKMFRDTTNFCLVHKNACRLDFYYFFMIAELQFDHGKLL